jgi:mono/diheme cytochrome c family protein
MVAFLVSLFLVLFIPLYWLYDIGIPALGIGGRLAAEEQTQYVTSVARGNALYLANCARCHGPQGQGGIGPPLNDQGKLYNALTATGLPGPGHLNPNYLHTVLAEGGRYVCGDPNSIMPAWLQPKGALNYIEVEEIIAFMLASDEISWALPAAHGATATPEVGATPTPATHTGWRDPDYTPPPGATPAPACWRGGGASPAPSVTPEPIASPGTPDSPRVIELTGTEQISWVNAAGDRVTSITLVDGETVEFRITNASAFVLHNFHIGSASELSTATETTDLPGVDSFTSDAGTQSFVLTVANMPADPQFACTVLGHYATMNGNFLITPAGSPATSASPGSSASPAASPSGSP